MLAVIVENLGAGSARPRRPHTPEVVVGSNADDPLIRQARDLLPDRRGFVIRMIDRDQQAVRIYAELPGQQLPREMDRIGFEVISKTEIT